MISLFKLFYLFHYYITHHYMPQRKDGLQNYSVISLEYTPKNIFVKI